MKHKSSNIIWITWDWQLAQLAMPAARDLWLEVKVLGTSVKNSVFSSLSWEHWIIVADKNWKDLKALKDFTDVVGFWNPVTTEWENIPASTLGILESHGLIPQPWIYFMSAIQDRSTEKELALMAWGKPVPYETIEKVGQIKKFAAANWGYPILLKTRKEWYDGKWQWKIEEESQIEKVWNLANPNKESNRLIAEKMIDLDYEVSVICARDKFGNIQTMWPVYNIHENWILRLSIDPAPLEYNEKQIILSEAGKIMSWVSGIIDWWFVWLLTIEMFVSKDSKIYVNEFAPRPHNSGHASLDAYWDNMSQNHLWLASTAGQDISWMIPKHTQTVVMKNVLSQAELSKILTIQWIMKWCSNWVVRTLYNYHKLSWLPNPEDYGIRKLWHVNHCWNRVELLQNECVRWNISVEEYAEKITLDI